MLKGIYSIYDEKAQVFQTPFFSVQELEAKRQLHFLVLDETTFISKFPNDFRLFRLGSIDTVSGVINHLPVPELVCTATELKGGR